MGLEPSKVVCVHLDEGEGRGSWQLSKLGQGLCVGSLFTYSLGYCLLSCSVPAHAGPPKLTVTPKKPTESTLTEFSFMNEPSHFPFL